jgi:hypothetical protein
MEQLDVECWYHNVGERIAHPRVAKHALNLVPQILAIILRAYQRCHKSEERVCPAKINKLPDQSPISISTYMQLLDPILKDSRSTIQHGHSSLLL